MINNHQLPLDLSPLQKFSFENYVGGSANRKIIKFLRSPMTWKSPITMLVGPVGTGKSHIGNAWANETGFQFLDDASQMDEEMLFSQLNLILNGTGRRLLLADKNFPSPAATPATTAAPQEPDPANGKGPGFRTSGGQGQG